MAVLSTRDTWEGDYGRAMQRAAARATVTVVGAPLGDPIEEPEFQRVFAAMVREGVEALVVGDRAENVTHRGLIVALAAQARLPAIYPFREFVEVGGTHGVWRGPPGVVSWCGRLHRPDPQGANPGELPYQLPTKFELVINLKTAKALGLSIPHSLLLRAQEVILSEATRRPGNRLH